MPATDILAAPLGRVEAPAGCGKTELIVETVRRHEGRPPLVLTHTNAGVQALQGRFARAAISASRYRLATLDGWALRIVRTYPMRAGYPIDLATDLDYPSIRAAAAQLIGSGALNDVLPANYGRVLVDEYQDCSIHQHALVTALSRGLPTCIFGDRLQAIFDLSGDELVNWADVEAVFPLVERLDKPWRWINANACDLGLWVLAIRDQLLAGTAIDLSKRPEFVKFVRLSGQEHIDHAARAAARNNIQMAAGERLLVIGDSINAASRHAYAKRVAGVGVVEPVDLKDLLRLAKRLTERRKPTLDLALEFAGNVMTEVNATVLKSRVGILQRGRSRTPATEEEAAARAVAESGDIRDVSNLLKVLAQSDGGRIFRRRLLMAAIETLDRAAAPMALSLLECAAAVREQRRHAVRRLPNQAIGSTLLLKGLEAEHVLILDASEMNARHLYVALSRGARSMTVFANTPKLNPTV